MRGAWNAKLFLSLMTKAKMSRPIPHEIQVYQDTTNTSWNSIPTLAELAKNNRLTTGV